MATPITVGRIVNYTVPKHLQSAYAAGRVFEDDEMLTVPAIVTHVGGEGDNALVNLRVFADNEIIPHVKGVQLSKNPLEGCWSWPVIKKEEKAKAETEPAK